MLPGNLFWIYGAGRVGSARAGPLLYFSPRATVALSATLLGEMITPKMVRGEHSRVPLDFNPGGRGTRER